MNDFQQQYRQKKKQHSQQQQPLSQEQRVKQELRNLPEGEELFNWICQQVANQTGDPIVWQYADMNEAQQQRSNRIHLMNGRTHETLRTIEVNRQEIAQTRAMGQSWVNQLMFAINDDEDQQHRSGMHEKFEQDMMDRFEEQMEKIQGGDQ